MTQTTQTHWKKNFNYNYLGSYSLPVGKELVVTIKKTMIDKVKDEKGKEKDCFVCYFDESDKPMILNKTNCKRIGKLYGDFIEEWPGKKIQLFSTKVSAFGDEVDALRVRDFIPGAAKIDNRAALDRIGASKTLKELQANYTTLSKELQADKEVIAAKDELKAKLA